MSPAIDLLVHITHEAGVKIGGIGAVLNGLLGARSYAASVKRSIVVGPFNAGNPDEMERLFDPRNGLRLRYARALDVDLLQPELGDQFRAVEDAYNIDIYYGRRPFGGIQHEVLLLDLTDLNPGVTSSFKFSLWETYSLDCARYEYDAEFSLFVDLAEPAYAILQSLAGDVPGPRILLAHEWMGMPLVMAAVMKDPGQWRTAFYAHEVATARLLVEGHPGHDTRFYNAMSLALAQGLSIDDVFGDQSSYYKHAFLQRAVMCDAVLAVGDLVVDELRFLGGDYRTRPIELVYNGAPSFPISSQEKQRSKQLLQQYAENLLGYHPDFVFAHVSRCVPSKALWRDLRVLQHLEPILAGAGKRAVLFVLSSSAPLGRASSRISRWRQAYGWPVNHRAENGDLVGYEVDFFSNGIQPFNQHNQALKAVLVNQFGWNQNRCGAQMPEEMQFNDLLQGADVGFGQSIYEPFGIAQVEPLSFGALCVVSNVCGCIGFVRQASAHLPEFPNLIVGDYVTPPPDWTMNTPSDALQIDQYGRDLIEIANSRSVAEAIASRIPLTADDTQRLLDLGQEAGAHMSWDLVVTDYLLPALQRAMAR